MSISDLTTSAVVKRNVIIPDDKTIVVSRIYNWLYELNDDVRPASCFVVDVESDFGVFFKKISYKLAESAGINVLLEKVSTHIQNYKKTIKPGKVVVFDSSIDDIDVTDFDEVYQVADSLRMKSLNSQKKFPGFISIFDSFSLAYYAHTYGRKIALDYAKVRDKDEFSSGRQSFMSVASQLSDFALNPSFLSFLQTISAICGTIKKGGFRRHGAMTATLKVSSPDIWDFIKIPFEDLDYIKKTVAFDEKPRLQLLQKLIDCQNRGELFFVKPLGYSQGIELRNNVCMGLSLIPEDQCLVSPVNLGKCKNFQDICNGILQTTIFLLQVREQQLLEAFELKDKQIAVGFCGLANLLQNFEVSYPDFISALQLFVNDWLDLHKEDISKNTAMQLVLALCSGIKASEEIAREYGMRAIFAIEPNASCSRRVKSYLIKDGEVVGEVDTVPNIDPPDVIPGVGIERRHSETGVFGYDGSKISNIFSYGENIFPAQQLTELQHFQLWDGFQRLINLSGLAHFGSYEQWFPMDASSFILWWNSSLQSIYYNRSVGTSHLKKVSSDSRNVAARKALLAKQASKTETNPSLSCALGERGESCEACD
jgi:hypothetical protein